MEGSRPAVVDDLPRIAELARAMHEELDPMKGGHLWAAREAVPEPYEAAYRPDIDDPDVLFTVGFIDRVIVGFGVVRVETLRTGERLGVISDLFVEQGARGVSVGESIAGALVDFCRSRACVGVDARALPGHRVTKNVFEAQGFTARAIVMHRPFSQLE